MDDRRGPAAPVDDPVGCQNSATDLDLGFYGSLVFVDEAAEDRGA
jgi:hypothetical protein